jgi:hypothetical protein
MPALAHVPGVARFVCTGILDGVNVANIFHVKGATGSAWSQADMNTMAQQMSLKWISRLVPLVTNAYNFTGVQGQDLTSDVGFASTAAASQVGGKVGTRLPNSASCCITWKTAAHYRGGHARTYLAPTIASDLTVGTTLIGTYVTAVKTAAQGFLSEIAMVAVAGPPALGLVRRQVNKTILTTPLFYPYTDADVDSRIDTQRRRLGKDR